LAYLEAHQRLGRQFPNYQYVPLTTREPENLDPAVSNYIGKRYLQDYFASGDLERDTGLVLGPKGLHVFLCGNPRMIGVSHDRGDPARPQQIALRPREPGGMIEVLQRRGLIVDHPDAPGNIHFEKYW
jgi:ferredoxin--NADP+ reductase